MSAADIYVALILLLILNFHLVFGLNSSSFRESALEQVKMIEAASKK